MATSNFVKRNAQNYYVLSSEKLAEELCLESVNELTDEDYSLLIDSVIGRGINNGYDDIRPLDNDNCLLEKRHYIDFGGTEFQIVEKIIINYGYYSDASLDYEINLYCDNCENKLEDLDMDIYDEQIQDFVYEITKERSYYFGENHWYMLKNKLHDRLKKELETIEIQVNDFLKSCSNVTLGICARFGNGETWYSEIS